MNFNKLGKFLGIFFLYIISGSILTYFLNKFGVNYNDLNTTMKLIINLTSDLIISIILFIIYKNYLKEKFKDFKNNFSKYLDISLRCWGIGLLIMFVSNFLLYTFSPVKEAVNENAVQELISSSPILAILFTTIFAPFIEEMIFRKSIQDIFKRKIPFIITSGFVFGLLHVIGAENFYDFLYIIPYSALGISFAFALSKTNNIYSTIMVHLIHNGALTLISILTNYL